LTSARKSKFSLTVSQKEVVFRVSKNFRYFFIEYPKSKIAQLIRPSKCKQDILFLDKVKRIIGVVYGANTANFSKYKKDIIDRIEVQKEIILRELEPRKILMNTAKEDFYDWECVSLITKDRTFDFIIKKDKDRWKFLMGIQRVICLHDLEGVTDHRNFNRQSLVIYKLMQFKMKMAY
jgi:hypothetical protein